MTVANLKRAASRLKPRKLKELRLNLMLLTRAKPEWKKSMAKKLTTVKSGKFVTAEQLEAKIRAVKRVVIAEIKADT